MRQLLDKGAPIDAKTADGDTPLSLAVSAGAVGSVGFLVKAGAALDMEDKVLLLLLLLSLCCCFFLVVVDDDVVVVNRGGGGGDGGCSC